MDSTRHWAQLFQNWPATLKRKGVLVTTLNDALPFMGFMVSDSMLVLERTIPDPQGSRFVMLGFDTVAAVKILEPLREAAFTDIGFAGKFSGQ